MTARSRNEDVRDLNLTAEREWVCRTNSCLFSNLPIPVSDEIFFKLPVKDVVRCKCVCTEWNNLLSSPNFSQNYAKNTPLTSILRCMSPSVVDSPPNVLYLLEISENGDWIQAPFNTKFPRSLRGKWSLSFVGSCNGFVCMKVAFDGVEDIYITNPIMGDPIALPELERDEADNSFPRYSFGFSSSLSKYKVLRIGFHSSKERNAQRCEILTVGVDHMWRRFPDSVTGVSILSACVAVNEAFHWLPMEYDFDSITTFDLVEENFGRISLPASLLPVPVQINLAALDNQLGVVDSSNPSQIAIWKMKKYSVVESWYKVFVLRTWFPPPPIMSDPPVLVSVIELKNRDMLFSYFTRDFISCNIEQKKCFKIELNSLLGHGRLYNHSIMTFTPNFSSPAVLIMEGQGNTVNVQSE